MKDLLKYFLLSLDSMNVILLMEMENTQDLVLTLITKVENNVLEMKLDSEIVLTKFIWIIIVDIMKILE